MFPHAITVFNKVVDKNTKDYKFSRKVLKGVFWYGSSSISVAGKGIVILDDYNVVIPIKHLKNCTFKKGDLIVLGIIEEDITSNIDLNKYDEILTITKIEKNIVGSDLDHFLIGGK